MSAAVRIIWRPLERWPREQTRNRHETPFWTTTKTEDGRRRSAKIGWDDTRPFLQNELRHLGAREGVVQLAMTEDDIRVDGEIKLNARLRHPGVVLTFTAPGKGVLTFACDRWTTWQANIRGVTKGLEALRLLDRYGIVTSGEQYTGWKELPSGIPLSERAEPEEMSLESAARIVVGWVSQAHDLSQNARTAIEDADYRRYAYRQALKHLHPDSGGDDSDAFLRLQQAIKLLDENDV